MTKTILSVLALVTAASVSQAQIEIRKDDGTTDFTSRGSLGSSAGWACERYEVSGPLGGVGQVVGYNIVMQDQDCSTPSVWSFALFGPSSSQPGVPDPSSIIATTGTFLSPGGTTGPCAWIYNVTLASPLVVPQDDVFTATHLPANPSWPADGSSTHISLVGAGASQEIPAASAAALYPPSSPGREPGSSYGVNLDAAGAPSYPANWRIWNRNTLVVDSPAHVTRAGAFDTTNFFSTVPAVGPTNFGMAGRFPDATNDGNHVPNRHDDLVWEGNHPNLTSGLSLMMAGVTSLRSQNLPPLVIPGGGVLELDPSDPVFAASLTSLPVVPLQGPTSSLHIAFPQAVRDVLVGGFRLCAQELRIDLSTGEISIGSLCYVTWYTIPCIIGITPCDPGWIPEGRQYFNTAAGDPGNTTQFTATIAVGGPSRIRFKLDDVSKEPGVCINYGTETDFDLKLTNCSVPFVVSADGQTLTTTVPVLAATVTVTSYDWGGWGKIRAICLASGASTPQQKIPCDDVPAGGNHIADAWLPHLQANAATWDDDDFPGGMERNGDGFTFYEEYRGTMNGTSAQFTVHERHSPTHKDLFLYDQDWLHLNGHADHQYGRHTAFLVHYLNASPPDLMNDVGSRTAGHRNVTWKSSFAHVSNQYALHVLDAALAGPGSWGFTPADPAGAPIGPPGTALEVRVDASRIATDMANSINGQGGNVLGAQAAVYADRRTRMTTRTTSHEMGHGTDVVHHTQASGNQTPFANQRAAVYWGEPACMMRYVYDLLDAADAAHPMLVGLRTAANAPPAVPRTRWMFSNFMDLNLADLLPIPNLFCTANNDCRGQIDVKD